MIISSEQLLYENRTFAVTQVRIQSMVKRGELIHLKRYPTGDFSLLLHQRGFHKSSVSDCF